VAWISLDEHDATAYRLWGQLTAALAQVYPALPVAVRDVTAGVGLVSAMASLVDWLSGQVPTWIVLDGVDAAMHRSSLPALAYLSANLPSSVRLVVTTHDSLKVLPIDPVGRNVIVLDRDELSLTPDEAVQIILGSCEAVDVSSVEAIVTAAEGWAAACRSAARFASRHPSEDAARWLATDGVGYLLEPWLRALSADRLDFLVSTALLDSLSGPLCDAVLGSSDSTRLLQELEVHGSYLIPVDSLGSGQSRAAGKWWLRHDLLTQALRAKAHDLDQSVHHMRAGAWFREHDDPDSAMMHLIAAGQFEEASLLLSSFEDALFETGDVARAVEWYDSLPPQAWGQQGWHLLRVVWGRAISGDVRGGEVALAKLRAHLSASNSGQPDSRALEGEAALARSYLASMNADISTAISSAQHAIDVLDFQSSTNSLQIAPAVLIRALLWQGDLRGARRELIRTTGQPFPTDILREAMLAGLQAQCSLDEGHVNTGRLSAARALDWLSSQSLDPVQTAQFSLLTTSAYARLESGDAFAAAEALGVVAAQARERGYTGDAVMALTWQARALTAQGNLAAALTAIGHARRLLQQTTPRSPLVTRIDQVEALLRFIGGDSVRAERLVQGLPTSTTRSLLWARLTLSRQTGGATRTLTSIMTDLPRFATEQQVLLATAAMRRSNRLAEGHLMRAADLASANGLQFAFLGSDHEVLDLAYAVGLRSGHDALMSLVATVRNPADASSQVPRESLPQTAVAGPALSAGEVELLTFLPRRDTNAQIASQLNISVNTVKTRLRRLYKKLGVNGRDDAVRVARARSLLS
jgi:LuxR family maltose regulon positive regulatory protein